MDGSPVRGSGVVGAQGPGTQGWELKITPDLTTSDLECGWLLQRIEEGGGKLQGERVGGSGFGAAPEAQLGRGSLCGEQSAARRWGGGPGREDRSRGQGGCRDCSSLPGAPSPGGAARGRAAADAVSQLPPQPAVAAGRPGQQDAPKW